MKCLQRILCTALPLLGLLSCDPQTNPTAFEDPIGIVQMQLHSRFSADTKSNYRIIFSAPGQDTVGPFERSSGDTLRCYLALGHTWRCDVKQLDAKEVVIQHFTHSFGVQSGINHLPVELTPTPPTITSQPLSVTKEAGENVSFSVVASGVAKQYRWQRGRPTQPGQKPLFGDSTLSTESQHTIDRVTLSANDTWYRCIVSNSAGADTSDTVKLSITAPMGIVRLKFNSSDSSNAKIYSIIFTAAGQDAIDTTVSNDDTLRSPLLAGYTWGCDVKHLDETGTPIQYFFDSIAVQSGINHLSVNLLPLKPTITTHPQQPQPTEEGKTVSFSVVASGVTTKNVTNQYSWQRGSMDQPNRQPIFVQSPLNTTANFTIDSVTVRDNDTWYRCIVSNSIGADTSDTVKLVVTAPYVAAAIDSHPTTPITVTEGKPASFTVKARGSDITYEWRKGIKDQNGVEYYTSLQNNSSNTFTISSATLADSNTFYVCRISNRDTVYSEPAWLYVTPKPLTLSIDSIAQPAPVTAGGRVAIRVNVKATNPHYTWQRGISQGNQSAFGTLQDSLQTGHTLTLQPVQISDSGFYYRCIITADGDQRDTSNAVLLSVQSQIVAPVVQGSLPDTTLEEYSPLTLKLSYSGFELKFQWQSAAINDGELGEWVALNGKTYDTLVFNSLSMEHNQTAYRCKVWNASNDTVYSDSAVIGVTPFVAPPSEVMVQQPQQITQGDSLVLSAVATGSNLTFSWQISAATSKEKYSTLTDSFVSGVNDSVLVIKALPLSYNGRYLRCAATNSKNTKYSEPIQLSVKLRAPTVAMITTAIQVAAGMSADFSVHATGDSLTYVWQKDLVGGSTTFATIPNSNSSTTSFTATDADSGSTLRCIVKNSSGADTTKSLALLTVIPNVIAPSITSQTTDASVIVGTQVTFTIDPWGTAPDFEWQFSTHKDTGYQKLPLSGSPTTLSGYSTEQLRWTTVAKSDTGWYRCKVYNSKKTIYSDPIHLAVYKVLAITTQPQQQMVSAGDSIKLSVATEGDNRTYTWYKNNTALSGSKSTLVYSSAAASHEGTYYCVIKAAPNQELKTSTVAVTVASPWKPATIPTADAQGMISIQAKGKSFIMGRDSTTPGDPPQGPAHKVSFSRNFSMGATEITQKQFSDVMKNAYPTQPLASTAWDTNRGVGDSHPAYYMSWLGAALYCNARTVQEGLGDAALVYSFSSTPSFSKDSGWTLPANATITIDLSKSGYRLPTEAEWEYACRGGTSTDFFWGTSVNEAGKYVWSIENNATALGGTGPAQPIKQKSPNPYGLYDILGNLHEFCNDWRSDSFYKSGSVTDPLCLTPTLIEKGIPERIIRGGGHNKKINDLDIHAACRRGQPNGLGLWNIGFRVVRTIQ